MPHRDSLLLRNEEDCQVPRGQIAGFFQLNQFILNKQGLDSGPKSSIDHFPVSQILVQVLAREDTVTLNFTATYVHFTGFDNVREAG